jgi:hypothetical protein
VDIRGNTVCCGCDYQDFGLAGPVFVSYLIALFMFPHTRRSCCIGGSLGAIWPAFSLLGLHTEGRFTTTGFDSGYYLSILR